LVRAWEKAAVGMAEGAGYGKNRCKVQNTPLLKA
jgi:hypothetical protein